MRCVYNCTPPVISRRDVYTITGLSIHSVRDVYTIVTFSAISRRDLYNRCYVCDFISDFYTIVGFLVIYIPDV